MKKITLKISSFLLFALFALQVQGQPCPELWLEPGTYKIAVCTTGGAAADDLYMTINGSTGALEWAALLPGDDPTQVWTVTDHRLPASSGYVEITADLSSLGAGPWTMIVDQSTYDGSGTDPEIRINARPGDPIGDAGDPNYGYDQFQRRKATGWTGAGNNALFAKPPGQGNLRFSVVPTAAGDQVLFQNGGTISPLRYILIAPLSTEEFDTSSIFISNPVKDELTIESVEQNIKKVSVYSLLGQRVMLSNVEDSSFIKLDVSSLNRGVYIVKMEGENNASLTKKIIKE